MSISNALNGFSLHSLLYKEKESSYTSAEALINDLSKCPQSRILFEEAKESLQKLGIEGKDSLEVRLEKPAIEFRATTQGNIITISPQESASAQRYSLLFELTNVIQMHRHIELALSVANRTCDSSEDYIKKAELIEYDSLVRARQIARAINKEKGSFFKPYIELKHEYWPVENFGFDIHYYFGLEDKHKEHHRKNWKDLRTALNMPTDEQIPKNSKLYTVLKIIGVFAVFALCTVAASVWTYKSIKMMHPFTPLHACLITFGTIYLYELIKSIAKINFSNLLNLSSPKA